MSVGDDRKVSALHPAPLDIANDHGPVVFELRLFADGQLTWKSPQSADPAMNEILFRGYFDKVRDTILGHLKSGGRIIT